VGTSRTYLSKIKKKIKKCRLPWVYTQKIEKRKKKSRAKNIKNFGILKKYVMSLNKDK